jgi:hypothetical protein
MAQFKYFGTTVTNQNFIQEEIKRRPNSHARLLPRLSRSWIALVPIDTHRKPITSNTGVSLSFVTYLLTLPRNFLLVSLRIIFLFGSVLLDRLLNLWNIPQCVITHSYITTLLVSVYHVIFIYLMGIKGNCFVSEFCPAIVQTNYLI